MDIIKFKKMSGSKYKVFFSNGLSIIIHEDIILKYNILVNKHISNEQLELMQTDNNNYIIYDLALKYINIKLRCEREIKEYLKKKNIEDNLIDNVIDKLKNDGYLNSKVYIKSYIYDKFNINNIGPLKIKKDLINLGFNEEDIDKEIDKIDRDHLLTKLNRMIDKKISLTKNYSGYILRKKIIDYFINKGFELSDIEFILKEKDLYNKNQLRIEYNKMYNKYSKKYSGFELEKIIKQKLYQKGFNYDDIGKLQEF